MATRCTDVPNFGLVMFQHPPQLGEFHWTSYAPPMKGKDGTEPNVGNRDARPLGPFEHATLFMEPALLSNVGSYVARRGEGVLMAGGDTVAGHVGVTETEDAGGDETSGEGC
jgi:hypothetical protein